MTSVQVRCVVERVPTSACTGSLVDSTTTAAADPVTDSLLTAVPASLPFHDLPHFVLVTRGYSAADSLAARGTFSRQVYSVLRHGTMSLPVPSRSHTTQCCCVYGTGSRACNRRLFQYPAHRGTSRNVMM